MSKKTIRVAFSEVGINSLINYLEKYQRDVEVKKKILLERLSELGSLVASSTYNSRSVDVGYEPIENGARYRIYADGNPVCFLEFGTGVNTEIGHPFAPKMPIDILPGSFSVTYMQQFYTWGYWYYGGVKLTGTEARPGMYEASKQIQQNVIRIAKEVFG